MNKKRGDTVSKEDWDSIQPVPHQNKLDIVDATASYPVYNYGTELFGEAVREEIEPYSVVFMDEGGKVGYLHEDSAPFVMFTNGPHRVDQNGNVPLHVIGDEEPVRLRCADDVEILKPCGPAYKDGEVKADRPGLVCVSVPSDGHALFLRPTVEPRFLVCGEPVTAGTTNTLGSGDDLKVQVTQSDGALADATSWTIDVVNGTGDAIEEIECVVVDPIIGVGWCVQPNVCGCWLLISYFPGYTGTQTKNWSDDWTNTGDLTYRSDFDTPASHYYIDLTNALNGVALTTELAEVFTIRWLETSSPYNEKLKITFEAWAEDWQYNGVPSADRNLDPGRARRWYGIRATMTTEPTKIFTWVGVEESVDNPFFYPDPDGEEGWQDDLESEDPPEPNTPYLPVIEVRENHIAIAASGGPTGYPSNVREQNNSYFRPERWQQYSYYPTMPGVSKIEVDATNTAGSMNTVIMSDLSDRIGSTNTDCPTRNCKYIDDYYHLHWPIETATFTGLTTVTHAAATFPDDILFWYNSGCSSSYEITNRFDLTQQELVGSADMPYSLTAGKNFTVDFLRVMVTADEFSDASVTTGKVKMLVTCTLWFARPIWWADDYAGGDYTYKRNQYVDSGYVWSTGYGTVNLRWEFEEDRWDYSDPLPNFELYGSDAILYDGGGFSIDGGPNLFGTKIYVLDTVDMTHVGGNYELEYATTEADLDDFVFNI